MKLSKENENHLEEKEMKEFDFNEMTTEEFYEVLRDETVSEWVKDDLILQEQEYVIGLTEEELEDYLKKIPYRDRDGVESWWYMAQRGY